jgi:hypothetical protein
MAFLTKRWKYVILIGAVAVVLFLLVQWSFNYLVVYGLYRCFSDSANELTGINPYLIEAIAWAVAIIVAYLGLDRLPKLTKWLHSVRPFAAFPVLFNLWLYWITKDTYFRFSDGKPLQWVAVTDHGLLSYAKPGFGPDGKPLIQVTRENFKNFKNLSSPLVRIDPEKQNGSLQILQRP